jgi:hypothetical protein
MRVAESFRLTHSLAAIMPATTGATRANGIIEEPGSRRSRCRERVDAADPAAAQRTQRLTTR